MLAFIRYWFYFFGCEGEEKDEKLRSIWGLIFPSNIMMAVIISLWAHVKSYDSNVAIIAWVFFLSHLVIQYKLGYQYAKNGRGFFERIRDEVDAELEEERREREEQRKRQREKKTAAYGGEAYKRQSYGESYSAGAEENSYHQENGNYSSETHTQIPTNNNDYVTSRLRILELPINTRDFSVVKAKYRELIKVHHPDKGGAVEKAAKIIDAYKDLKKEFEKSSYAV